MNINVQQSTKGISYNNQQMVLLTTIINRYVLQQSTTGTFHNNQLQVCRTNINNMHVLQQTTTGMSYNNRGASQVCQNKSSLFDHKYHLHGRQWTTQI